jgi:1-aminocyclopropane-1-carboxylate deaminase
LHFEFLNFYDEIKLYCPRSNKFFNFAKTIPLDTGLIDIQPIQANWLTNQSLSLDILRLDKLHNVISGNKWFKLKYYLEDAITNHRSTIATFGGAWSNHIIAAAYAAKEAGLKSVGIIRGEQPEKLSFTLQSALACGMDLHFVSRDQYRKKQEIMQSFAERNWYWIEEGGFGKPGAKGATEILKIVDTRAYTHIIAAVGTGTMLAGLVLSSNTNQMVIGISSMKGNNSFEQSILNLTDQAGKEKLEIQYEYHFGGYGKCPDRLVTFMNDVYTQHALPLDIVYTAKTFYAVRDLAEKKHFKQGSKLLMIHSGGLQGNKSLPAKVLAF